MSISQIVYGYGKRRQRRLTNLQSLIICMFRDVTGPANKSLWTLWTPWHWVQSGMAAFKYATDNRLKLNNAQRLVKAAQRKLIKRHLSYGSAIEPQLIIHWA